MTAYSIAMTKFDDKRVSGHHHRTASSRCEIGPPPSLGYLPPVYIPSRCGHVMNEFDCPCWGAKSHLYGRLRLNVPSGQRLLCFTSTPCGDAYKQQWNSETSSVRQKTGWARGLSTLQKLHFESYFPDVSVAVALPLAVSNGQRFGIQKKLRSSHKI